MEGDLMNSKNDPLAKLRRKLPGIRQLAPEDLESARGGVVCDLGGNFSDCAAMFSDCNSTANGGFDAGNGNSADAAAAADNGGSSDGSSDGGSDGGY
jgi:hypothetical protein